MTLKLKENLRAHAWIFWSAGAFLTGAVSSHAVSGLLTAQNPDLVLIDPGATISDHKPIPREALAPGSPVPSAGGRVLYSAPDQSVRVGVWETDPGTLLLDMHFDEYVHILEGSSTLRRADGKTWRFKAGDSFLLPSGFKGQAQQTEHFRKEYVDILSNRHPAPR